ncbi:MAG: hypothetical protein H6P98_2222, partial [Candidatus Aminicenantes bacterium]|nr:hypothetical protein [Candidatus Aminicenantes bacterium]
MSPRGHEAGGHLDALGPEPQEPVDVFSREDAARGDDGEGAAPARLELVQRFNHLGNDLLEAVFGIFDLLGLESQMSARAGALDDHAVGDVAVGLFPGLEDEPGRPGRADDRHDLDA